MMSRNYEFSEAGEAIAVSTELKQAVEALSAEELEEKLSHVIPGDLFYSVYVEDMEEAQKEALNKARVRLASNDIPLFDRAMELDASNMWRYQTGELTEQTRLFGVPEIKSFTPCDTLDKLVLSGAIGNIFENRQPIKDFLRNEEPKELGFERRLDLAAFVGAYVVHHLMEIDKSMLDNKAPHFEIKDKTITSRYAVSGTFHGDFRIIEEQWAHDGAINPLSFPSYYCPVRKNVFGGYHGVETSITAAMLESAFIGKGIAGAKELLDDFYEVIRLKSTGQPGDIEYQVGNFGDYGSSTFHYELSGFHDMVSNDIRSSGRGNASGYPYLPQSETLFGVSSDEDSIFLGNWEEYSPDEKRGITFDRQHFATLFKALIEQAQQGLGRTAPYEHIGMLKAAAIIIDDPDSDEWLRS